jgi:PPP family 3-phenylpropionic acid transporter
LLPPSRGSGRGLLDVRAVGVFVNWRFAALAGCAMAAMGAMSAYYMYFSIYLDEVGIADNMKGYFWAIAVASETGMMWVIGRVIGRIGVKWTFVLSIAGCAARLFAFSFPLGMGGIAAAQCLHALTFAAFMVSTVTFVNKLVPQGLRASGQTMWMALTMGVGPSVGGKLAGAGVGALGLVGMFRVFSLGAAFACAAAAVLVKEPEEKREGG